MMNDIENEVEEQQAEEIAAGGGRYRLKKVGVTASEKVFERGDPVEDVDALVRFEFDGLAVQDVCEFIEQIVRLSLQITLIKVIDDDVSFKRHF